MTLTLPYSMFYLSLLSFFALVLTIIIVRVRYETGIGLGAGDSEKLTRQIRVQANFLENFLPFSILFILTEINNPATVFLHIAGGAFFIARLFHAYGFSHKSGRSFGRYYGTLVTWLSLMLLIAVNFYQSFMLLTK